MQNNPVVYLIGAGPGDPELLTVKAVRILKNADVVVYDRLVSKEIMDLVPTGTARIDVGKQPCTHPVPQDDINALLVRLAEEGKRRVVRLKGGDPFTFGRGGEESLALSRHGINVEVIPGVTAASGCAAALGIPLTHRGLATGVRYVTGHCRDGVHLDLNWKSLADPDTTLVIYMGLINIAKIRDELIKAGLPADTPAGAIERGTTEDQRTILTTLKELPDCIEAADLKAPSLLIIGRVVGLAPDLGWYIPPMDCDVEAGQ